MTHESLAMQEASDGTEVSAAASASEIEQAPAAQVQDALPGEAASAGAAADPIAEVASATESEDEFVAACGAGAPKVAMVVKYSDRVPVQLKSRSHLEELIAEHGAGAVEVQS